MIDFDIGWKEAPGVRDPVLARTWCALTIRVGDQVVTRVSDRRTHGWRNAVYGSVFPMCAWVVDNFWFLLYEPYRWAAPYGSRDLARNAADRPWVHRHSLLAAREGGALPDLTLCRDGAAVLARWLRDGDDTSHPFLRFVQEGFMRLEPEDARRGLARLVETVLTRVADMHEPEVAQLRDDWRDLQQLAPDEESLCIWSARLGVNAHYEDELSDADALRLRSVIDLLEPPLTEDLFDTAAIETINQDVEWIQEAHTMARRARRRAAPRLDPLSDTDATFGSNRSSAYAAGYAHARNVRQRAGIAHEALPDLAAFVHRFGWADSPVVATTNEPASDLRAVVDYGKEDVAFVATPPGGTPSSDRFLLARSLFLQACTEPRTRRLATASHTWGQRASRAFAAELLAPAEALRQRIHDHELSGREVGQLASEFAVDRELIERQVENHALATVNRRRDDLRQW